MDIYDDKLIHMGVWNIGDIFGKALDNLFIRMLKLEIYGDNIILTDIHLLYLDILFMDMYDNKSNIICVWDTGDS